MTTMMARGMRNATGHHVFWADVCRPRGWAARLADRPAAIAGCAYRPSGGRSVTPQWQSRPFPAVQFPPVVVPPLPLLSGSSVVGFLAVTEMVLPLSTCVPAAGSCVSMTASSVASPVTFSVKSLPSVALASAIVLPRSLGTLTCGLPVDT